MDKPIRRTYWAKLGASGLTVLALTTPMLPTMANAQSFGDMLKQLAASQMTGQQSTQPQPQDQDDAYMAAATDCNHTKAVIGGVLGAVAGNLIGAKLGGKHNVNLGRVLGTGLGTVIGASIGAEMDHRACKLKALARQQNVEISTENIPPPPEYHSAESTGNAPIGMSVSLVDSGRQFASGSDILSSDAEVFFGQVADNYSFQRQQTELPANASAEAKKAVETLNNKVILLIGHTDDTGPSGVNASLSERRAHAVAKLFEDHGIPSGQIYYQGAGEAFPIADNRTEEGRAKNRRVEIVDLPDLAALTAYLADRFPRVENYRPPLTDWRSEPEPIEPAPTVAAGRPLPASTKRGARPVDVAKASAPPPPLAGELTGEITGPQPPPSPPQKSLTTRKGKALAKAEHPAAPQPPPSSEWDFGGAPVSGRTTPDIGRLQSKGGGFSLVAKANADTLDRLGLSSCEQDKPRVAYAVKSLKTGEPLPYSTGEFMPGLYGGAWQDKVNGHMIGLTQVAVLRNGTVPVRPTLVLYRDFVTHPDPKRRPDVMVQPDVNIYRGDKAMLYRIFTRGAGSIRCIDLMLPATGGFQANPSNLYYQRGNQDYTAGYMPKEVSK